jgi:hypothetical protein
MKKFDLKNLTAAAMDDLAVQYHDHGFALLTGIDEITSLFPAVLSQTTGTPPEQIEQMLEPENHGILSPSLRQQLSKVPTTPGLSEALLQILTPLLLKLLGPIVHVSSNFHAQFKEGSVGQIGYSGFHAATEYVEIHGPHLLHQDFAAASFPISPSMITLWVALNTTSSWNLRLHPGSHRQGVLCDTFLDLSHERLKLLQSGLDISARKGEGVLFNGMMLHGTGKAGPERRASCDIRFFPFCGFLPSEAHLIHRDPLGFLQQTIEQEDRSTLQTPLYQDLVFLGKAETVEEKLEAHQREPYSPLYWIHYLVHLTRGNQTTGIPFLRSIINRESGVDPDLLVRKFKDHPLYAETLRTVRQKLQRLDPDLPGIRDLDSLIQRIA